MLLIIMELIFIRHGESTENIAIQKGESYDVENIMLTQKGIKQAIATGSYLNVFDNIDKIYTSPVTRCVETSQQIMKSLKSNPQYIDDDLLIEAGEYQHKNAGLSADEQNKIMKENIKLTELAEKIISEKNPFIRLNIMKQLDDILVEYLKVRPSLDETVNRYKLFLNKMVSEYKDGTKRVIVVCHGGTIEGMMYIITNISRNNHLIKIMPRDYEQKSLFPNCCIMCVLLYNNVFELVTPPNDKHLNNAQLE